MLDDIDRQLVELLVSDSRMSLKQLGQAVGLSSPSTSERLRRLEERGVVRRFTADIDPRALGYPLQVMVRIRPLPGNQHLVQRLIEEIEEICECDKVTGEDCFIARIFVRSIEDLDRIIDPIVDKAETNTAFVKSQVVRRRPPPFIVD